MFDLPHTRNTWVGFVCAMGFLVWAMYGSSPDLMLDTDDAEYLTEAAQSHRDFSRLFSADRNPVTVGRPVVDLVFWVDYALWKDDWAWYHYQAVLLHLCASLLLALVFHQLGASMAQSFLGALLFSVNIAHFRVVHWIAATGYSLALVFSLIAILWHHKALQMRDNRWSVCAAFALGTAVFCHPSAVSALLFCAYLSLVQLRRIKRVLVSLWLYVAVAVLCLGILFFSYPQASQNSSIQSDLHIGYLFQNALWFMGRLFSTAHWLLAPPIDEAVSWEFAVGGLCWLLLFALVFRQKRPMADWAVWTGLTLLPFLNYLAPEVRWFPAGPSRYLYFASAGTSFLMAFAVLQLGHWVQCHLGRYAANVVMAVIVVGLVASSVVSERRVQAVSFYASGRSYVARADIDRGIVQFQHAIDRDPELAPVDVYQRLAKMQLLRDQSPERYLQIGRALYPENSVLLFIEGLWDAQQHNDPARVARGLEKINSIPTRTMNDRDFRRNMASVYHNLGIAYHNKMAFPQAVPLFEKALEFHPDHPTAAQHLGLALWFCDRPDDALRAYQRAVEINPNDRESYLNIARIFLQFDRYKEAQKVAELILGFDPESADAYDVLGAALGSQGDYKDAERAFLEALKRDGDHIPARLGLAALYETDRPQMAAQLYREILARDPRNGSAQKGLQALLP